MVSRKRRDRFYSSVLPEIVRTLRLTTNPIAGECRGRKHPNEWPRRITGHLKLPIFILILAILAARSVVAEENGPLFSRTFTAAEAGFNLDYSNNQMAERAIEERLIHRLGLFDPSDSDQSSRYSVSLDVENEDSDWSFEVTITVEF